MENEIINSLVLKEKNVYGIVQNKPFIDIGLPIDYQRAENFLEVWNENMSYIKILEKNLKNSIEVNKKV